MQVLDVGDRGLGDAQRIDAAVMEEVLVLGGKKRIHHPLWNGVDRHEDPLFGRELGQ